MIDQPRPTSRLLDVVFRCLASVGVLALLSLLGLTTPAFAETTATPSSGVTSESARSVVAVGYTYWGYFTWDEASSKWELAPVGANDKKITPKDGDVFGFRWALNVGTGSAREPRADGDFAAICGEDTTGGGTRIAFVLDYGTATDAVGSDETPQPRGVCATVQGSSTVQQALLSVVDVRTASNGLVCGIDGYPSQGCGDTVKDAQKPSADQQVDLSLPGDASTGGSSPGTDTKQTSGSDSSANDSSDDSSNKLLTIGVPVIVIMLLAVGALVLRRRQS